MPLYTFRLPAAFSSTPITVYNTADVQQTTGTTDANAVFTATLPTGDYYAKVSYGYRSYRAAGEVDRGDLDNVSEAALSATFARATPARLAPGARWAFLGDSITYGTGATNTFGYAHHSIQAVGGMIARPDSFNAGLPGDNAAGALSRTDAMIAAGPEAVVLMIGTNDAATTSLASYKASVLAIFAKVKAAGLPMVVCTVPPRATSVAVATRNKIDAYNDWLRQVTPRYGFDLADTYAAIADTTTGGLLAANDSGDALHPNNLGHMRMAIEVAKAMLRLAARSNKRGFVKSVSPSNLVTDPLVLGGTTSPSGWFEWPGGTGTAPTYSLVADTSGMLAAGRWGQMDFDATGAGGFRRLASPSINAAGNMAQGDRMLIAAQLQFEDVSGTWLTDVAAGTAGLQVSVNNSGSGATVPNSAALTKAVGVPQDVAPSVYDLTVLRPYDAGSDTAVNLWFGFTLPTGKRVKMRYGCLGLINLTTRGSASEFSWGTGMVAL